MPALPRTGLRDCQFEAFNLLEPTEQHAEKSAATSDLSITTTRLDWWAIHQQVLHILRDFDALQKIRPHLAPSSLAYRRLEREQARIGAAIGTLQ